jgi:hypothetical protein
MFSLSGNVKSQSRKDQRFWSEFASLWNARNHNLALKRAPRIPKDGAIPDDADSMPEEISYNIPKRRLMVGSGFIDNVPPTVQARRHSTGPLVGGIHDRTTQRVARSDDARGDGRRSGTTSGGNL